MNTKNIKTSDFLALAFKIPNMSSLSFANAIKSSLNKSGFKIDKMGFLGTLDPFACGQLLLASNSYTRLLHHIHVRFKTYRATLFLGLDSRSLDTENIERIEICKPFSISQIKRILDSINDKILEYFPPKFSAKHINGARAYKLARDNLAFDLTPIQTHIKRVKLLNYCHPFLSFEITLSSGGYVRSIGGLIAKRLGVSGALCYLERLREDNFCYLDSINLPSIVTNFSYKKINYCAKLLLLPLESALKYDKINLKKYEKDAICGRKIRLDSKIINEIFGEKNLSLETLETLESKLQDSMNTPYSLESKRQDSINVNSTLESKLQDSMNKDFTLESKLQDSKNLAFVTESKGQDSMNIASVLESKPQDSIKTQNSLESKRFLADFATHFSIIDIQTNGEIKYILNNIKKP